MRCLIVGCGSIGSRRARLLAEMGHEVACYDADYERARAVAYEIHGQGGASYIRYGAVGDPRRPWQDVAFVCTPAATHVATARAVATEGLRGLFIEKPLSTSMAGIPELIAECEKRGVVTMGACNMRWAYPAWSDRRFRPKDVAHAAFYSFGALDGWRPGAREAYAGNGIALESAIHEMDLAAHMFGPITDASVEGHPDKLKVRLTHASGTSSLVWADWSADAGEPWRATCFWLHGATAGDGVFGEQAFDHERNPDSCYRQEMAHFLDCVANGTATTNPIANAAITLGWALKARDMTRTVAA